MRRLYLMDASPLLEEKAVDRALAYVEEERRERIARMKQEKPRALSLAAGLLFAYGAAAFLEQRTAETEPDRGRDICRPDRTGELPGPEDTGRERIPYEAEYLTMEQIFSAIEGREPVRTKKAAGGKPAAALEGFFFNLSHSGDYAACAVSHREVGVDIQQRRDIDTERMKKRVLHRRERAEEVDFFQYWAAKEAFVKCTGDGLSRDFRELCVNPDAGKVTDTRTGDARRLYLPVVMPGYFAAVCEE